MHMILFILLIILSAAQIGCVTTVKRWTLNSPESQSADLPVNKKENIFFDFLWTTPPIKSHKLDFTIDGQPDTKMATVPFSGQTITFSLNNAEQMQLRYGQFHSNYQSATSSARNLYYDISALGQKVIPRERQVAKTRWVTRYESVQKSRMVTKSVPVQKSRQVSSPGFNGTTTYRTEYYTTNEMRTVTEYYYTMEPKRRMETYYVWETVYETFIDIPSYNIFSFTLNTGENLIVYKIESGGTTQYYFQNASYYSADDSQKGYWGGKNVKILAIDANSNGIYFEDDDRIMFNSWNPYERNSNYQNIRGYMDNFWYQTKDLKEERFISISLSDDREKMKIKNGNDKFVGTKETGYITVNNIPRGEAVITINGRLYRQNRKGILDKKIEYGRHRLRISYKGYEDYIENILIDDDNSEYSLDYQPTVQAGKLNIAGNTFRHWKLAAIDNDGKISVYEDQSEINLKEGKYNIEISSNGMKISKEIDIKINETSEINIQQEIEKLMGEIPSLEGIQEATQADKDQIGKTEIKQ